MSSKDPTTLSDLTPDPRNARVHDKRSVEMIESGMGRVGAARSIVIDEDGVILAGNATVEAATRAGIERVIVVDVDGDALVAVRRTGLTDSQKVDLALLDNRTSELSGWSAEELAAIAGDGEVDLSLFWDQHELDAFHLGVPSLDDVEAKYGEPGERDGWPVIRVQVPPETLDEYESLMRLAPGPDEAAKLLTILRAVNTAALVQDE